MASSPVSASDGQRRQAIIRFVGNHEQVLETNRELMRAESVRQSAEENLRSAENQVQMTVRELDARFDSMARAYADLKLAFSSDDPQPTRSMSSSIPPPTLSLSRFRGTQPAEPSPSRGIPPSTGQTASTPQSSPPQSSPPPTTQGTFPAYVVYCGKDGVTGIFYSWYNRHGLEGAKQYITLEHHLVKGFGDIELAQEFYSEFADSSAATVLSTPIRQKETFVLLEGVLPGVYHNRKTLLWKGLQFRGGVVELFTGSKSGSRARARFSQADENNEVRVTHQPQQVD
ncbi:hypothetical protein PQX77_006469 [Marasmius sp. AFHP31]|nr:hypothetical protein PQX77_006469 [Marasmius sp. AFHP31]